MRQGVRFIGDRGWVHITRSRTTTEPADLVLEVPAGTADSLGWKIGDRVTVDPPTRPRAPAG